MKTVLLVLLCAAALAAGATMAIGEPQWIHPVLADEPGAPFTGIQFDDWCGQLMWDFDTGEGYWEQVPDYECPLQAPIEPRVRKPKK